MRFTLFCFLVLSPTVFSQLGESFHLDIYNDKFVIVPPEKWHSDQHVILHNKTLLNYRFKKIDPDKGSRFFSIKSGENKSISIIKDGDRSSTLIPLSPPGEEIFFNLSEKQYEFSKEK